MHRSVLKVNIQNLTSTASPRIWNADIRAVLLNMHSKEANVHVVDLLEGEDGLRCVGDGIEKVSRQITTHCRLHFDVLFNA